MKRLAALVLAAVVACGPPPIETGTIIAKDWRDAYTSWIPITTWTGKTTTTTIVPQYHPPRFWVVISDGDQQATWYLPEGTWDHYQIGDGYP